MEEKSESIEKPAKREQADGNWVRRPNAPSGTSIEIASLTKADRITPEMLELLHQLMVRAQEFEAAERDVLVGTPPDCPRLGHCGAYGIQ
ncbi:hypothetical protein [Nonomuraea sp. NPDC050202]|jgi:hypothetical protein|uniref:hypothetical protein n=1 Tax=Nonomuraea sp. NPDC050202 TaxID=3155035 RepID=UPI0033DC2672